MTDPLTCQADAFSLPEDLHYLNCAYMAPLPRATEEAIVAGLVRKRVPVDITPDDFFRDLEEVRRRFASIVHGDPERVVVMPSAAYGISLAARNLPVEEGQRIVVTHEQFPGNVYAWRRSASDNGAEIVTVHPPEGAQRGEAWSARVLEAVTPGTAVVALPHVHWTDGTRFDLEAIGARAREVGAALVIDGTQSVGAMDFDVEAIRPDALVCATYKWLLGPYSVALAYLGERFDDGVPLEETWMGREESQDFQRLVNYRDAYQPGARRYDMGEVANFALLPGVMASLGLLLEWGVERIQDYCAALTGDLLQVAAERGFSVEAEGWRGEHVFGIRMRPDVELDGLKAALDGAGISVSLRGTALRVSPNVYNDAGDVEALTEVLAGT